MSDRRLVENDAGWWEIRWTERDAAGRPRSRSLSTRTKDRAIAEAVRRRHEQALALAAAGGGTVAPPPPGPRDVGTVLAEYQSACWSRGVRGGTQDRLIVRLADLMGAMEPEELTHVAMVEYQMTRIAEGAVNATIRRELGVLAAAMNWGHKRRLVAHPVLIDLPPAGAAREVFWPEELEGELFDLAARDIGRDGRLTRVGRFICLGLDTGARKSAILGLEWDRIDLNAGLIDFRDPSVRLTKKKRVATPITTRLKPVLERAARDRRPRDKFVLDSNTSVDYAWDAFMRRHNFSGATPHVMRHTRITLLLRAGVSVWDVAGLVGLSPTVIQSVYGQHVADDRLRAQANRRFSAAAAGAMAPPVPPPP